MIDVQGVSKTYGLGMVTVTALREVTLQIPVGAMVCIMGKSGSGKSTLLRQLGLIDRPSDGLIHIDGQEVVGLSERRRSQLRLAKLGYVFQEYALVPELTAEENVYLPALMLGRSRRESRSRARELLELVGLGARVRHRPRELSGGEQQRVAIARALVNRPLVIYADEPTANLDTESRRTVMETLSALNHELGVTVLYVTHDPDEAFFAKTLLELRDGALVSQRDVAGAAPGAGA